MATERLGNIGYFGLIKEVTKGTPLTPTDYIPLYDESFSTEGNFVIQKPIYGSKFENYNVLQGQRSHTGDVTLLAEPNTVARVADMLLTKGTTTGSNPYTQPYTVSNTTDPNSYTVDISMGNSVARYWGFQASKLGSSWNDNELQLKLSASALGSFQGREIASVSTNVITLTTTYDPNPTKGLVASDLVRIFPAAGTAPIDTTVTSITATTVTVASAGAAAAGDMITLRPATPSFNLLPTFLWSKTQFCFGATASAALSATHYPLESGSNWEIMHDFEKKEGAMRSGSFDPAALVRTTAGATFKAKKFYDTPEEVRRFNALEKQSVVIRHYAGVTNQYELRLTLNNIKTDGKVVPDIKPGDVNYSELDYTPQYDITDGQGMDLKVINGLATV